MRIQMFSSFHELAMSYAQKTILLAFFSTIKMNLFEFCMILKICLRVESRLVFQDKVFCGIQISCHN